MRTAPLRSSQGPCGAVVNVLSAGHLAEVLAGDSWVHERFVMLNCQMQEITDVEADLVASAIHALPLADQRRFALIVGTEAGSNGERLLRRLDRASAVRVGWRADGSDMGHLAVVESWPGSVLVLGRPVIEECMAINSRADIFELQQAAGRGVVTIAEGVFEAGNHAWLRGAGVTAWFEGIGSIKPCIDRAAMPVTARRGRIRIESNASALAGASV